MAQYYNEKKQEEIEGKQVLTEEEYLIYEDISNDLEIGHKNNFTTCYPQFNDMTLADYVGRERERFDGYIADRPDFEPWMANTVRPLTRLKVMSLASHALASYLYPSYHAFSKENDTSVELGQVATLLVENGIKYSGSNYLKNYHRAVITALSSATAVVEVSYEKDFNDYRKGGARLNLIRVEDFLISNPYESDIQRQDFVAVQKHVSYLEAKEMFGGYESFQYVEPGKKQMPKACSGGCGYTKYETHTELENECLIQEYYNFYKNIQAIIVNGVLIKRSTIKTEGILYPFAKLINQEFADTNFFWGKSQVSILASSQDTIDTVYNQYINGLTLSVFSPKQLITRDGSEAPAITQQLRKDISTPLSLISGDFEVKDISPSRNPSQMLDAMNIEQNFMSEATVTGLGAGASQQYVTAQNSILAENNRKIIMGLFGKQIDFFVKEIGVLLLNEIKKNITVADTRTLPLRYKSVFLPDKKIEISFSLDTSDELEKSFELAKLEKKKNRKIFMVNPVLMDDFNFHCYVDTSQFEKNSVELEKITKMSMYDRAIGNPVVQQNPELMKKLTWDVLFNNEESYSQYFENKVQQVDLSNFQAPAINNQDVASIVGENSANSFQALPTTQQANQI